MIKRLDRPGALAALGRGEVVAVPTDTVYGLAASIKSESAISTLFSLKHRPSFVPLPLMVGSLEQIHELGVELNDRAKKLADAFWPGALTIVLSAPEELARLMRSPELSVGFRIPDHRVLRDLLALSGPLAVTSANDHGEAPCHTLDELGSTFAGRDELAGVLDGGECRGEVSTVVDVSESEWRVIRERAITRDEIGQYLD